MGQGGARPSEVARDLRARGAAVISIPIEVASTNEPVARRSTATRNSVPPCETGVPSVSLRKAGLSGYSRRP